MGNALGLEWQSMDAGSERITVSLLKESCIPAGYLKGLPSLSVPMTLFSVPMSFKFLCAGVCVCLCACSHPEL